MNEDDQLREARKVLDYEQAISKMDEAEINRILANFMEVRRSDWNPCRLMEDAWSIVLKLIERLQEDPYGLKEPAGHGFSWVGPIFKSKAHYLTNEGYPLGTECWYVVIEWDGYRHIVCADTPQMAICRAALRVI